MSAVARLSGTLLPAAGLVAGTLVFKQEYLPFAIAAAAAWGAFRVFTGSSGLTAPEAKSVAQEAKKAAAKAKSKVVRNGVLDPDDYQEFPLKEKKITSHNTAMSDLAVLL